MTWSLPRVAGLPADDSCAVKPGSQAQWTKRQERLPILRFSLTQALKHTQLPERQLRDIGIVPTGQPIWIMTSNGKAKRWLLQLDLEVQGRMVKSVDVNVGSNATPLVGRSTLYGALQTTAVTSADWLQEF